MMAEKSKLKGTVADIGLNKNLGNLAFWIHRISGFGLTVYLLMHTYVLSSAISSPRSFDARMGQVQNPFFAVLEILLIAGVLVHMLNGLRITLIDFFDWSRSHKALFWAAVVLFALMMVLVIYLQLPKFNPENYGMGG